MGISHLPLDFGLGDQRGYRVDNQDINRPAADQGLGDLQGLLSMIGLGDQQIIRFHTQSLRVSEVQSMFRINEGAYPSQFLRLGDDVQGQGRFS